LLSGEQNLHVQAVAETTGRIEEISEQLDDGELRIVRSNILSEESSSRGTTSASQGTDRLGGRRSEPPIPAFVHPWA